MIIFLLFVLSWSNVAFAPPPNYVTISRCKLAFTQGEVISMSPQGWLSKLGVLFPLPATILISVFFSL
jgi:hypothetical protein